MPAISFRRAALLTIGLVAVGYVAGVLVGACVIVGAGLAVGKLPSASDVEFGVYIGITLGGPIGALIAPVAWRLGLRRTPFGPAIGIAATGSSIGGILAAIGVALAGPPSNGGGALIRIFVVGLGAVA